MVPGCTERHFLSDEFPAMWIVAGRRVEHLDLGRSQVVGALSRSGPLWCQAGV
jgi:hypothetical protein